MTFFKQKAITAISARRLQNSGEIIMTTLRDLKIGEKGRITKVGGEGALRQHFLDMGLIPGASVQVEKFAPMGDPVQINIHGYSLTLRLDDAGRIGIDPLGDEEILSQETGEGRRRDKDDTDHPGLGEGGKYHVKEGGESSA